MTAIGSGAEALGTAPDIRPQRPAAIDQLQGAGDGRGGRRERRGSGSLSECGWDDEGIKPEPYDIVKNGIVVDYQTTREQAPYLDWYYKKIGKPTRSHGNSYAQFRSDVQYQRMPNVNLLPGAKDTSWDDIIAATDRGIALVGSGSFSIDQQRYNAQFGGQVFDEVRGGKITGMLEDVAYQIRTPEFWAALHGGVGDFDGQELRSHGDQ